MTEIEYTDAVRRNSQRLYLLALSFTRRPQDAEDVMQSAFCKLWQHRGSFGDSVQMDKWLTKVAVNECRSLWRRHAGKTVSLDELDEPAAAPEREADQALVRAVLCLPEAYRTVIHLFYYEEYSIREIAGILRCREGTVKSQLSRGRSLLKTMLKEEWDDDE